MSTEKPKKSRPAPIRIECKIIFVRIIEVDSKNEKFNAECVVECAWNDDKLMKALLDPELPNKRKYIFNFFSLLF
ncbi:hypothetical protein BpHYR1_053178 [Brachionus plicatilis]|uniref:Uncharacterized protein n=1 Tax=Brachionus plicatilis TaxID=10195 RepID=A0A3M7S2F8_BRAPC|nr:hypothetical protein BpHYR1_053178 [Brachionus plicatilis]